MFFCYDTIFSMMVFTIGFLFSVAWITHIERKLLGGIQLRKGPNFVSAKGMLQPLFDFIKLLQRKTAPTRASHYFLFCLSPLLSAVLAFRIVLVLPAISPLRWGALFFFFLSSLHLYPMLSAAWSSNRVYALLSVTRARVLAISYEIPLLTFCLAVGLQLGRIDFQQFSKYTSFFYSILFIYTFLILFLSESHRLPFDFVEAERELVSGYNVEFGGWGFALLIVAEYRRLIFVGQVASLFFFGNGCISSICGLIIRVIFLRTRGALPRFSLQNFMRRCWSSWLPLSFILFTLGLLF